MYLWTLEANQTKEGKATEQYTAETWRVVSCKSSAPDPVELVSPANGETVASDKLVTVSWKPGSTGELCNNPSSMHYSVFVSTEANFSIDGMAPWASVQDETTIALSGFEDGETYYWVVAAENGVDEGRSVSAVRSFVFCLEGVPSVPVLFSPAEGEYVKRRDARQFQLGYDAAPFGKGCTGRKYNGTYTLEVQNARTLESLGGSVVARDTLDTFRHTTFEGADVFQFGDIPPIYDAFRWRVVALNEDRKEEDSGWQTFFVCDEPTGVKNVQLVANDTRTPTNASSEGEQQQPQGEDDDLALVDFHVRVQWDLPTSSDYGVSCGYITDNIAVVRAEVYVMHPATDLEGSEDDSSVALRDDGAEESEEEAPPPLEEVHVGTAYPQVGFPYVLLDHSILNETDAVYVVRVVMDNGADAVESEPVSFKTSAQWCGVVLECSEHGTCNEETRACDCEDGWEGTTCDGLKKEAVNKAAIIGGSVAGGIVGLMLIAILITVVAAKVFGKNVLDIVLDGPKKEHRFVAVGELVSDSKVDHTADVESAEK